MITATNYAPNRFRGVQRCTVSDWPTHAAGTPKNEVARLKCSKVVFGTMLGDRREVDLFLDLGPGESVQVDPMQLDAVVHQLGDPGDLSIYGRPAIGIYQGGARMAQIPFELTSSTPSGAKFRIFGACRFDALTLAEIWIDFVPGQHWARWELLVVAANPSVDLAQWFAPGEIRLEWADAIGAIVVRSGMRVPVILEQGASMAHGSGRAFVGVVAWQPLSEDDRQAAFAAGLESVAAVETTMSSPIGLPLPVLGKAYGPTINFATHNYSLCRDSLEGLAGCPLGPVPYSGQTGNQEDEGYAKGGEISVDAVGNVLPSFFSALGMARRPCHWVEANGQLLDPARTDLVLTSGAPNWNHVVSPDRLGQTAFPNQLQTGGWSGPDREHWFYNRLWFALAAMASPCLYRLAEHQAQLWIFSETTKPGWSTSHPGPSRAVGWSSLIACNLLRLLKPGQLRDRLLAQVFARIELVLLPELEPKSLQPIPVMGTHPASDTRSGILPTYPFWWQTWQQGVGAFGVYMLGTMREVVQHDPAMAERLRAMAGRFAAAVMDFGSTEDATLGFKTWDNVGLRADGLPLTAEEWQQGIGASTGGNYRLWAQPLAFWTAAMTGNDRARTHYQRLFGEALSGARDLAWLPPLP